MKVYNRMNKSEQYNGWKNYETWNVALWIGNDEGLYRAAESYDDYQEFVLDMGFQYESTPDNVAWMSDVLDYPELNEMMEEL